MDIRSLLVSAKASASFHWPESGTKVRLVLLNWFCAVLVSQTVYAADSYLDTIGATLLQRVTTNLNGKGIRVAQAEAGAPTWEVNPGAVGQPLSLFTYYSSSGSSPNYPNALGSESSHADTVAGYFYGLPAGLATNIAQVNNYEAGYFYNSIIASLTPPNINDRVVNQSFNFSATSSQQQAIDSNYDNYAAQYNTLFVSGVGNGGAVNPPATCYNGVGVGAYGGGSSMGPTPDNGRAKPDLTAPAAVTSYSTPQVAGAAALLAQAGLRGDGGSDTNSAADIRAIKALLLNGAIKPTDWTNATSSPLDARYGAGVLNVFNSYKQLTGGKQAYVAATSVSAGSPHPPTAATGTLSTLSGWDFNTITSSHTSDGVNHYYFNVTNTASNATFTATATLVWNRQLNKTGINNLDLFLYEANSGTLIAASTSTVDNVEHLFVSKMLAGRYDLQVLKNGGVTVSNTETYALAFEFFTMPLGLTRAGTNMLLAWPIYPAGFVADSTTDLAAPTWSAVTTAPTVVNSQNSLILNTSSSQQYYRLRRP